MLSLCLLRVALDLSRGMTKTTKWPVRPVKTQISLVIRPVWPESSLCALWATKDPMFLHADIRLGGCPCWSESSQGAYAFLLVLSWSSSFIFSAIDYVAKIILELLKFFWEKFLITIKKWKFWPRKTEVTCCNLAYQWATSRENLSSGFATR